MQSLSTFRWAIVRGSSFFLCLSASLPAQSARATTVYSWTTLAGRSVVGDEDGPAPDARFYNPHQLCTDLAGNLYVADTGNHTIRKIATNGIVSTLAGTSGEAGSADGMGAAARFNGPQGVAVDAAGNVYVADTGNHIIRKITPAGSVSTLAGQAGKSGFADGAAGAALFDAPDRLTADASGTIYLYNHGFRKISGGQVVSLPLPTQVIGTDGQIVSFAIQPSCPAVDAAGLLYLIGKSSERSIYGSDRLLRLDSSTTATALFRVEEIFDVDQIFNDAAGNLYVTMDYIRFAVQGSEWSEGLKVQGASTDPTHRFTSSTGAALIPLGVTVDQTGNWVYTRENALIGANAGTVRETAARDGTGPTARFTAPTLSAVDTAGNIWVAENPTHFFAGNPSPVTRSSTVLRKITLAGAVTTVPLPESAAQYWSVLPTGLAADGANNVYLAIETREGAEHPLYRIAADGTATVMGQMPHSEVLGYSSGLVADARGRLFTMAYSQSSARILQHQPDGSWTSLAGGNSREIKDGTGDSARFSSLSDLRLDRHGDLFVSDHLLDSTGLATNEFYLRKISPDGTVTTLGKNLTRGIEDSQGRFFSLHSDLHTIVQISPEGQEQIIGGRTGVAGSRDGSGETTRFAYPEVLMIDAQDNLYLIDGDGTAIRRGQYLGSGPAITGQPQSASGAIGGNAQFSVAASATPAPSYQWYFAGHAITGATATTLTLSSLRSADAGDYSVVVTNSFGSTTSNKASLTVTSGAPVTPPSGPSQPATGGGGGAFSDWFLAALLVLGLFRRLGGRALPASE